MSSLLANRYQVLRELGRGGMGVVHAVSDTLDGSRQLALKTIRQDAALTPHQRLRFKEEFRAMARLEHPNTVKVHDFGVLDAHSHYLTMEIVPGQELEALISDRGMPVEQACRLLIQLLQALGFIHARGYVHRDIKAANIRVTEDGTLKLMDFGLMEPIGQRSTRTITGTPGYMPPEVVTGGAICPASDLYSVGCLAMEMLTGRLPFTGTLSEVVRSHAGTPPEPLRSRRPELPEALERIVSRLLRKDPKDRYAAASEVVADLAGIAGLEVARDTEDQRRSFVRTSELVGREPERQALEAALAGLKERRSAALLIGAPAGVGKSRLLEKLLLTAKLEGVMVLKGRCDDSGQAPYQAVGEALKPLLALTSEADRSRHARAIACLRCTTQEEVGQEALEEAIWAGIDEAAERAPLLWLMEDMHWADAPTLALVNKVIRRLADKPIMVVATFRDDEVEPGSPIWHTVEDGASRLLRLGPLSREEQRRMLEAMLGPTSMIEGFEGALYQATGGNAFFLTEVIRALLEEGQLAQRDGLWHFPAHPDVLTPLQSIQATVCRRVRHLSPGARALAAAAAVIGHDQDLAMLLAVSCFDEEVFFARLEELIA
ncbi:MAG: protein kinase domain-containing protein, partial [Candidatus Sericytochromatia bacterium]